MTTNPEPPPPIALIERRTGDLLVRVRRYFMDNPREELTHDFLRIKFGCNKRACRYVLATLKEEGLVESVLVVRNRLAGIATEGEKS